MSPAEISIDTGIMKLVSKPFPLFPHHPLLQQLFTYVWGTTSPHHAHYNISSQNYERTNSHQGLSPRPRPHIYMFSDMNTGIWYVSYAKTSYEYQSLPIICGQPHIIPDLLIGQLHYKQPHNRTEADSQRFSPA